MKNLKLLLILGSVVVITLSCGKKDDSDSADLPSVDPGEPPTATLASPLTLKIYTEYDGYDTKTYQTFTQTGTTTCEATDSNPDVTCTIEVQEGRLYFSSVHFQFSWLRSKCKILSFQPYYYIAFDVLNPGSINPPWSEGNTIDCSANPIPPDCFGGAAPYMVSEFPKFRSILFLPDESIDEGEPSLAVEDLPSANSVAYASNRMAASDLPVADRGSSYDGIDMGVGGDYYYANSFRDYVFTCRDDFYDPEAYRITVTITDVDSAQAPLINNFLTWREVP